MLIIVILAGLLIAAVYWLVVRHVLSISRKVSSIGSDDRLNVSACREITALAESVNELADEYALRERREEELQIARQHAEDASLAKSHFLSSMSHELRTPMNAVLGFAQLLVVEDLTTEQQDSVNEILVAGEHMVSLIDDVLDLSRIESDQLIVNPEVVAIGALIADSLKLVNHFAREKGISINFDMRGNDEVHVLADKTRLKQVLINLLTNAIKYNCEHGSVEVLTKVTGSNRIRVDISDTGDGLDKNQLENLFTSFNRFDAMEKGIDGLGIGLVICKHLIEAMSGRIGASSRVGEGSTFWVELEVSQP
ncbi:PAS/PAC sensor hybrid histidine kinase [gamma proteobacterium IMCC2047]|nr:PAS/PAC sensor hybrid histidine kinase [gamma proteobacterium IMCC2047]